MIDRLILDGEFSLASARFAGGKEGGAQSKVEELSWRARGRPGGDKKAMDRVVSNLTSEFHLEDAQLIFEELTFDVPGANVLMNGTLGVHRKTLDFTGKLRMEANVSEAVGGYKSFFLKLVDPIFEKDGAGAVLSVKVKGTLDEPDFGVDF